MDSAAPRRWTPQPVAFGRKHQQLRHFESVETRHCRRLAHYTLVCVAVICVCLVQNYFVMRDVFHLVALGTLGSTVPMLLIGGALARRHRRAGAEYWILSAFGSLPVWAFWLFVQSRTDHRLLAVYGLTIACLMFVWYNATFGVSLSKPSLCYFIVIVCAISMFLRLPDLSWRVEMSLSLIVVTSGIMAMLSNVFMQRDEGGFVSEGKRLMTAMAAGRHDLWAFDIPSGHIEVLRATQSGPRSRRRMTFKKYLAAVHPDDRQYVSEHIRECLELGASQAPCQYRVLSRLSGESHWCEAVGKVVERDMSGRPLMLLGMTNNISDQKQLTRQMQQQADMIARVTRAKSEFLANMSHEIRTPLNGILGMASMLEDADLTARQREMVSIIRSSGAALLQILNDVLDFSKLEAGKLAVKQAPFAVREVAVTCLKGVDAAARQKSVALNLSVAEEVPLWLTGDSVHLSTVLSHLLSNAVKFTNTGRIDLSVFRIAANQGEVERVVFEVRDTGIGIDAEAGTRIFAPFTQAHGNGLTADSGVGLGLALSKRLVEALGGRIAFKSDARRGSCFTVILPLAVCVQPESPLAAGESPLRLEGVRVLVAEDNPVNQAVMLKMLKRLGYAPAVVSNGQEALAAVQNATFDLVFMDCEMPVLDGLEATRRIRELPSAERLPIVALSAHPAGEHKAACISAGMSDYLSKPIDMEALRHQLNRWGCRLPDPTATKGSPTLKAEVPAEILEDAELVAGIRLAPVYPELPLDL